MDATSNSKTTADPIAEALAEARKQCEYAYQFCPSSFTQYALASVRTAEKVYGDAPDAVTPRSDMRRDLIQ